MKCPECQCKIPPKRKFCSRKCANTYRNKNNHPTKGRAKKHKCRDCDNFKEYKSRFLCNECFAKKEPLYKLNPTKLELTEKYKHLHSSSAFGYIRFHARDVVMKDAVKCEKCGYDKHVEIAHKKAISDYPDEATILEINDVSNLLALCPNCHWEFDH